MTTPPLQLAESFFTSVSVNPVIGKVAKDHVYPLQTRVDFHPTDQPDRLIVRLGVRKGANPVNESGTYTFNVEICGIFSADPALFAKNPDTAISYIHVNGPSMLLGSVRELILQITGRGPFPAYTIPTLSFADLANIHQE